MVENSITLFVLFAIVIMMTFAIAVIWFLNRAQKKITETKLKEQENELAFQKDLLFNTVKTQEEERTRISAELHDDITSKLNVVHLNVHLLKQKVPNGKEINTYLNQIDNSLKSSIDRSRSIAHELMPVVLKKFGLKNALEDLVNSINLTGKFEFNIIGVEILKITEEFEMLHIFRIIQELLNNAIKYSQANVVTIVFKEKEGEVNMTYSDNGIGLDKEISAKGMGFSNINTRIRLLGGQMAIVENVNKKGLIIDFKFPNYDKI